MTVDGAFVIGFANAMVKLRKANDATEGVTLDHSEVKALVDALKSFASKERVAPGNEGG